MSSKQSSSSRRGRRPAADVNSAKIGFVGAGKIVEAIIGGLTQYGQVDVKRIHVAAPSPTNTDRFKATWSGIRITKRNLDIFAKFDCDIIFLAVNGNVIQNCYKIGGSRPAALTTNFIPNMKVSRGGRGGDANV